MKLTDFLGKEYGPGNLVLYAAMSGRCPNIVVGRVEDIYEVYRDRDSFKWKRLAEGELPPLKTKHSWFDADGNMVDKRPEHGGEWREYDTDEREETSTRVKIQPLRGARWQQHHAKSYYVDTRSGKRIDPDRGKGLPHVLKESHYVHADGTEFDYAGAKAQWEARISGRPPGMYRDRGLYDHEFRRTYHINYEKTPGHHRYPLAPREREMHQLWWVGRSYQPWVEKRTEGPKPVTIEITGNIVKWEGELPDAVPDEVS